MGRSVAQKLIESHLVSGDTVPGKEIALSVDQTLLQDSTGTMAWQEFEMLGVPRVQSQLCVQYVDHNTLQATFHNAEDHIFLQGVSARYGAIFSRPGNGISHFCYMERFDRPGASLLGADSHTTHAGALGMLAIGAGGLEVAQAMAGGPLYVAMPNIALVRLHGQLKPWSSAKDVILELLRQLTVRGGVGKVFEFGGPGLKTLSVPQRATIANMTTELGATAPVFPSDEVTREWLRSQRREQDWQALEADPDATYAEVIDLDLSSLEPLIAQPSSPDNVVPVREIEGTPVVQVAVGSSVNSSYRDLMVVAEVLKGKHIATSLQSVVVAPGSRQILLQVLQDGGLASLLLAGVRELEVACGPCIGMGQAPPSFGNSLRTFNRNFPGRSGTSNDRVYLASPEVAAATALHGVITDPRRLGDPPKISMPKEFLIDDSLFIRPPADGTEVEVVRGPNIKPPPLPEPPKQQVSGAVIIKTRDNVSTDDILPGGAEVLPLRSNIPAISEYTFRYVDPEFPARCRQKGGGFIVGGTNYGQGSSREHAAIAPLYLGIKAVLVRSFARIHHANLVVWGVPPLLFDREEDYARIEQGDELEVVNLLDGIKDGVPIRVRSKTKGYEFTMHHTMTERQQKVLLAGGFIRYFRQTGQFA